MEDFKVGDIWEHEEWPFPRYELVKVQYLLLEDRGTSPSADGNDVRHFLVLDLTRNQTYEMWFTKADQEFLNKVG